MQNSNDKNKVLPLGWKWGLNKTVYIKYTLDLQKALNFIIRMIIIVDDNAINI